MMTKKEYEIINDIVSFLPSSYAEFTEVEKKLNEHLEVKKPRGWPQIAGGLFLEGLTFGLYDPHFTREEKEKSILFKPFLPIKEKILDKIPIVKHIADALLPYDVSIASVVTLLPLGLALRLFGGIGGAVASALRLSSPLLKISSPIASRVAKVFTKEFPEAEKLIPVKISPRRYKLVPETLYQATKLWERRIYNSIAVGIGVGIGHGIKGLYEASQGKKNLGEAIIDFAIAPFVSSLLFPLIDIGGEMALRKSFPAFRRLLTRSERELLEREIKSSNKTSAAGEQLASTIEKKTEEELAELFAKAFEKNRLDEALKKVASPELLSKLEKAGITKITFSHFEDVSQIANEALRAAVNRGLRDPDYIKYINDPVYRRVVESFVNHFKLLQQQEIAKAGMTLGKLFDELRVEREIRNLLPEDLRDKPFTKMTIEEKQRAMEIINQNAPYLNIVIGKPEVLEKLNILEGEFRTIQEVARNAIKKLITEYLNKLTPEERKEFWKRHLPDTVGLELRFSNEALSYLYHLRGEKPEKIMEREREKLIEALAEGKLLSTFINQLAKQTKIIFDLDDKGELLINVLSNISKEGNAKKHLLVLEKGFRNATYSQIADFERKKSLMWEDPLIESLEKIMSGKREIPEGASKEQIIKQIQERIAKRKLDPAKWIIEERIPVFGDDYDIWVLAADAYKAVGKDVGEVVSALEQHYTKGKFDEKIFENAFKVFKAKYPQVREIEKSSKTPTEKIVKLLEYLKNEKDKFEFTKKDVVSFSIEKTPQETLNKIETVYENAKTHIHKKVKEKFFAQEAFEKIPNELLDIYKEAENKKEFSEKINKLGERIFDYFVLGGKYGLAKLPKEGDRFVLLRPEISNRPIEFYVERVRKGTFTGETEIGIRPVREEDKRLTPGMVLRPEQLSLYSLLAEAKTADSLADALYKVISKYSIKNQKVAQNKGLKLKKISFEEALRLVGYEPDPVDEILTGKRKIKIPDDTWEDWKMLFGDDLKRFGTKNPKFEPADSVATEYGFEREEEFKNYLADRLNFLKLLRKEARNLIDHYEFDEKEIKLLEEELKKIKPSEKEVTKRKSSEKKLKEPVETLEDIAKWIQL